MIVNEPRFLLPVVIRTASWQSQKLKHKHFISSLHFTFFSGAKTSFSLPAEESAWMRKEMKEDKLFPPIKPMSENTIFSEITCKFSSAP